MTTTLGCKIDGTDVINAMVQLAKDLTEDAERNRQELWECLKSEEVLNTARINCPYCNWVLRVTNSPIRSYCEKHWTDLIAIEAQRRNLI